MIVKRAASAVARAQAPWIAAMEPWRGLGYRAAALASWLGRMAKAEEVWTAGRKGRSPTATAGVAVVQGGFLLGSFIALVAVRPEEAGRGVGRALLAHVEARVFARARWLYVSADGGNRAALAFYRKLGFCRVGRLPDLIRPGRAEILLRKGAAGR